MFIELPCGPCMGLSRGVMYIGKGDGTFEELCEVKDIPEFETTTYPSEEEVNKAKKIVGFRNEVSFQIDIRPGTKSWRNLKLFSIGWTAKGPIRRRARANAFWKCSIWRLYTL